MLLWWHWRKRQDRVKIFYGDLKGEFITLASKIVVFNKASGIF